MEKQLRRINLDGATFHWRVTHRHQPDCLDQLLVFREGTSSSPLRILFQEGPDGGPEYLSREGLVQFTAMPLLINLHKPKTVAILTRRALDLGWTERPMTIENGFAMVLALPEAVRNTLNELPA